MWSLPPQEKGTINETNSCRYYPRHRCSCRGGIHDNFEGPPRVHGFFRLPAAAFMPAVLWGANLIAKVKNLRYRPSRVYD
jgi:hypothetical protein